MLDPSLEKHPLYVQESFRIAHYILGHSACYPQPETALQANGLKVVAIEDHYEICFDPEDEQGTLTFQDVVTLVQRKLQQRAEDAS